METIQSEKGIPTIALEPVIEVRPPDDYLAILAVPDNCANCPESSCCPFANDKFHGTVGYTE